MITPGTLLVAHPDQQDPVFANSVVLITENHTRGTLGLVINKPHDLTLDRALQSREWPYDTLLYRGGPVNPTALVMLHSHEWFSSNTMSITSRLSISSDGLMLEKAAGGNTPQLWRFISGMSGWAPGQLASEIAQGRWLTTPGTDQLIWESQGEAQWKQAIEQCAELAVKQFF